jgi:large subunit ribosomal protein L2
MQLSSVNVVCQHVKRLTIGKKRTSGRNLHGHVTVRGRGGGVKTRYVLVDFLRNIYNIPCIVRRFEKDANRSAFIMLVCYQTGVLSYFIAPKEIKIGFVIVSYLNWVTKLAIGMRMPLRFIPSGYFVHNVSFFPLGLGKLGRSAGTFCQVLKHVVKKNKIFVELRLPSKEVRLFDARCFATIGVVSNMLHKLMKLKKAGENRWLGRRPIVRGVAKNPVDHPHGGGQGKTSGGRCSVSPWSVLTKGFPTRKKNKVNPFILISKRKAWLKKQEK